MEDFFGGGRDVRRKMIPEGNLEIRNEGKATETVNTWLSIISTIYSNTEYKQ